MKLRVSRILHAGYVFESGSTKILFDPIFENPFSRNCFAFPNVEFDRQQIRSLEFDAVFISHDHDDHFSFESLDLLDRQTPIYLYSVHQELFALLGELGFQTVHALRTGVAVRIGDIEVTPHLALDPETDSLFQIRHGDINVLNVVDAWIDPASLEKLTKLAPWDVVLWPFQTLREIAVLSPENADVADRSVPPEWTQQLKQLKPRIVVPSSCQFIHEEWSWYNKAMFPITYEQFARDVLAELPETEVRRLDPSMSLCLADGQGSAGPSLSWVLRRGPQGVDYEYDANFPASSTQDIAGHFPALGIIETERVLDFCRRVLQKKFVRQGAGKANGTWTLSVFDHRGEVVVFQYPHAVHWQTEVPIAKLYAALENGESLTSMYVRVKPPQDADLDVMDDPLIKVLFDGKVGSFQRAQLEKLRRRQCPTSL